MINHKVVSRDEWIAARKKLLAEEKELARQSDELAKKREGLPWVKTDKEYQFETPVSTDYTDFHRLMRVLLP